MPLAVRKICSGQKFLKRACEIADAVDAERRRARGVAGFMVVA